MQAFPFVDADTNPSSNAAHHTGSIVGPTALSEVREDGPPKEGGTSQRVNEKENQSQMPKPKNRNGNRICVHKKCGPPCPARRKLRPAVARTGARPVLRQHIAYLMPSPLRMERGRPWSAAPTALARVGRRRSTCKECGGGSICVHSRCGLPLAPLARKLASPGTKRCSHGGRVLVSAAAARPI